VVNGKTETVIATNGAVRAAMEKKGEDAQAVAGELARLWQAEARLGGLIAAFEGEAT
jgi:hypothetical protein